jgi:uncharacterized protein YPO0396
MAIDERTRHDLYTAFEELWGPERADAMMSLLPPVGWADVATKHDLDALRETLEARIDANAAELRGEMAGLRTELKTEMAELRTELRTEMSGLETGMAKLETGMAGLKTELKTEIAELRAEFHASLAANTRTMVLSLTSSVFLVASFAFGAAYLV